MSEHRTRTDEKPPPRVVYLPPRHEWGKVEDPPKRQPRQPAAGRIRRGR